MKRFFKNLIECLIVFAILVGLCFYINKDIVMKALYMDDLYHWSWFRGLNLYEFAFKFYEASRYRPIFEAIQYMMYVIIDTDPTKIIIFNKIYNSIVALFIYHFIKRVNAGRIIAMLFSALFLISHLSYYQIGQGIGNLETTSLFFTLIILFLCLKLIGVIKKPKDNDEIVEYDRNNNILNTVLVFIMYILISFTHERFLGLAVPIVLAIIFSKDKDNSIINKRKIISICILTLEIVLICIIRYFAIGKVMPAGTGGTYVEDTFSVIECLNYCFVQVAFIFGMNIGPEHLVGIEFANIVDKNVKTLTYVSICLILVFIVFYLILKIKNIIFSKNNTKIDNNDNYNNLTVDLIFLSTLAMCIGASSVTIRVEMRFVYVSFTIALIYLSYMSAYVVSYYKNILSKVLVTIIIVLIFVTRIPVEMTYRVNYDKIYCFMDAKRVNSIYDHTIGKYGLDDFLHNKKVYLIKQYFDMNEFYAEYLFKIYDKENIGNKIIIIKDLSEIPPEDIGENTIILYEDLLTNTYLVL